MYAQNKSNKSVIAMCAQRTYTERMPKSETLNIRIDAKLKERARKAATADHRSLASLIEKLLEDYCDAHEGKIRRVKT
jgi:predicted HicB family RNase H-like nuclease